MEKPKNKTITDRVWDLFASVKFAVVIFSFIALTSVVGTIIEQNARPESNLKILTKFFGESLAPSVYSFLQAVGFMDMYHSWWFVTLLLLFALNLIICSLDRLPRVMKLVKEKIRPLSPDHLEKMSIKRSLVVKGNTSDMKERVTSAMKEIGFSPASADIEKGVQLYAEKGNFTRLGVYITHLSILVILVGAILGVYLGFNAHLNLLEGQNASSAYMDGKKEVPFGFELRCDNFELEFYPETDMPKAYKSWLSVIKNGQVVKQKMISVNDPLTYEGITFYQSSFGTAQELLQQGTFIFKAVSKDGKASEIQAKFGDTITLPGTSVTGKIKDFSPALGIDPSGRPYTYDTHMNNPAVFIEFSGENAQRSTGWIFKRLPRTWDLSDGNRLEFLDYWGVEYTGLQVRKDPGVFIVYLGCIIMAMGLYITFFMSHRRLWIHVSQEKGSARIMIGASAHRNKAVFEGKIERLMNILSTEQKGGKA